MYKNNILLQKLNFELIVTLLINDVSINISVFYIMYNHSWMYLDLPQGLYRKDYSRRVEGFIDFSVSNLKNISEGKI